MNYFLDTNICIYALKNTFSVLADKFKRFSPSQIKIPSIVKAELLYGALKSDKPKKTRIIIEGFLFPFEVVSFDDDCCEYYAKTRSTLEMSGKVIGPNDLVIAATALANHAILVTHNVSEFHRVEGLLVEDWTL